MNPVIASAKALFSCGVAFGVIAAVTTGSAGCSSSSAASNSDSGNAASDVDSSTAPASLCDSDPRAQTFTANMVQAGANKLFGIKLVELTPYPVIEGNNAWTVQVVDATGAPVDGATFTLKPFMPDHGHGSSIIPDIQPQADSSMFDVSLINCFMPGIWTFTFSISKTENGVTQSDTAVATFCVDE